MIQGDYHTHTIYSKFNHGKGSILQNAISAKEKGLKEVAITDHGFNHFYGVRKKNLDKMRKEILEAEKQTGLKIYLGLELNFISLDGDLDISPKELEKLDIVLAGYHKGIRAKKLDKFKMVYPNVLHGYNVKEKQVERNTNLILKALDRYPIDIITHLGYKMKVDVKRIAIKAKEKGTLIELNNKRINFTKEDVDFMVKNGNKFILNSDAHNPEKVGDLTNCLDFAKKFNIPNELIVNFNDVPVFKKTKK